MRRAISVSASLRVRHPPMRRAMQRSCRLSFVAWPKHRVGVFKTGKSLQRSEEHTSELQSLMRISYAVFCLKKKKKRNNKVRPKTKQNKTNKTTTQHQ